MVKPISHILHSLLLLVLIGAGGSIVYSLKTAPGDRPVSELTPTRFPTVPSTRDTVSEPGWSLLQPGLERRVLEVRDAQDQTVERVYVWRLDQNFFRLDVAVDEKPKSLESWQAETRASLVMNGGYFRVDNDKYVPNGLTVVNGNASGRSYAGYGGMLAINASRAELRWLVERPYQPSEMLRAALQSFPMLVKPGGQLGFGAEREDLKRARRTAIGQDRDGRILFIVAPQGYFTLHGLSAYLTNSDLDLDIAINLDGGGSTGIMVANPREIIPPNTLLPFVILAYPR